MGEKTSRYHHGLVIKEFREKRRMSQPKLAEHWPRSDGGTGVSVSYIVEVEAGRKGIDDQDVLRRLCILLDIPFFRFGLSEYDPFTAQILPGRGKSMHDETLDVIESLVRQIWSLRCAARISDAERGVKRLGELFAYFEKELPPPLRLERRFTCLYVQYLRLKAVTALEKKKYKEAMDIYQETYTLMKNSNEPSILAVALGNIGKELERKGEKQDAVYYLEEARDVSMGASKLLMAHILSYLIRVYASNGDQLRFERAVNTGLTIARSLPGTYEDGTDFVYSWSPISAILAEQSWGYIELGQPEKTLALRDEITKEITIAQDARVEAWIPLDWAKAYKLKGEIEKCIEEARVFYHRCKIMQSPHAVSQVNKLLATLDKDGYSDVQTIKDFREEMHD